MAAVMPVEMPGATEREHLFAGERTVAEGLGPAREREQVELGPGGVPILADPAAVEAGTETGRVATMGQFKSRDDGQCEYCQDNDSAHGSNYPCV